MGGGGAFRPAPGTIESTPRWVVRLFTVGTTLAHSFKLRAKALWPCASSVMRNRMEDEELDPTQEEGRDGPGYDKNLEERAAAWEITALHTADHNMLPSQTVPEGQDTAPWLQQPGEPYGWYGRFERYYLLQGIGRSVMGAEKLWKMDTGRPINRRVMHQASPMWVHWSRRCNWIARAQAWDQYMTKRATEDVAFAMRRLRQATPAAVNALITRLDDPKLAVQAAREILDRGGIPAVTKQQVTQAVSFTSDDMADAAKEAEEWEKQQLEGLPQPSPEEPSTLSQQT
jgi:hypothetical protein